MSIATPKPDFSLVGDFSVLEDPCDAFRHRRLLLDMVVIAIAATFGGADRLGVDIAQFGRAKEALFRRFLDLPNGIPSYDTFGRVFSLSAPERSRRVSVPGWPRSAR